MSLATKTDTAKRKADSFVHLGFCWWCHFLGFCFAILGIKPSASCIVGKCFSPELRLWTSFYLGILRQSYLTSLGFMLFLIPI